MSYQLASHAHFLIAKLMIYIHTLPLYTDTVYAGPLI
jgi:hypothetical protein